VIEVMALLGDLHRLREVMALLGDLNRLREVIGVDAA
jgi:hypothetical protein